MKNAQKYGVLIWADRRKINSKGLAPLYARISMHGKRSEFSLNLKVNPDKWNPAIGFLNGSSPEVKRINAQLVDIGNGIAQAYADLSRTDNFITAEKIRDKFTGTGEVHRMLLEVFDEYNAGVEKLIGKDYVKATHTKYFTVRSKVAAFIKHKYHKSDLHLEVLDFGFVTGLESFLKLEEEIQHNTAMRYMKIVKQVIKHCISNRWLIHNPLDGFKRTYRKVQRLALDWNDLEALKAVKLSIKRLDEVRDTFLFCCFTGYAFVDVEKLSMINIVTGQDGVTWVKATRTKTEIDCNVPLMLDAFRIIKKYDDHDCRQIEGRLLPVKSNQKMNAYLKEIADLAGINKTLTTHIARHTFATTVTLENDVPLETVSKMLGHTELTTIQIYAKMRDKKVNKDMHELQSLLNNRV
jgi:site-specific recombinase XerD